MIVLAPAISHAPIDPNSRCQGHDERDVQPGLGWSLVEDGGTPRAWRLTAREDLTLVAPEGRRGVPLGRLEAALTLEQGTALRLDAVRGSFHCDGEVHSVRTYRFCVLDGALSGYCVEVDDVLLDDHLTHSGDGQVIVDADGRTLADRHTA